MNVEKLNFPVRPTVPFLNSSPDADLTASDQIFLNFSSDKFENPKSCFFWVEPSKAEPEKVRKDRALKHQKLERWFSKSNASAVVAANKGLAYLRLNQSVEAEAWLRKSLEYDVGLIPARSFLGEALRLQGRATETIDILTQNRIMGWGGSGVDLSLGLSYWQIGDLEEAQYYISSVAFYAYYHPMPQLLNGLLKIASKDKEGGLDDLVNAAHLSGNHPLVMWCLDEAKKSNSGLSDAMNSRIQPRNIPCCIDI